MYSAVDRHHHKAEEKTRHAEEAADALFDERPNFLADVRQLPLEIRHLALDPGLNALAIRSGNLIGRRTDLFARSGRISRFDYHRGRRRRIWNRRGRWSSSWSRGGKEPIHQARGGRRDFLTLWVRAAESVIVFEN
jgi:hypothetical protein